MSKFGNFRANLVGFGVKKVLFCLYHAGTVGHSTVRIVFKIIILNVML